MISKKEGTIFKTFGYTITVIVSVICLVPFWLIVSASFSQEEMVYKYGYTLIPKVFSLEAYRMLFEAPDEILNAYKVSVFVTLVGASVSLFIVSMTAYVLLRKNFRYRNVLAFMFYFSNIFSAGLIPLYILIATYFNLKNNILALIIPPLLNAFHIILMRNFMKSVPESVAESAKIDGANEFQIFIRLYLPMSTPGLATVGLFIALFYWNNWSFAMMFIENRDLYPLQYYLYDALNKSKALEIAARESDIPLPDMPAQTMRMAIAVVATGPIVFLYPFIQKYFVKGLTVGAVKG